MSPDDIQNRMMAAESKILALTIKQYRSTRPGSPEWLRLSEQIADAAWDYIAATQGIHAAEAPEG